MSLTLAMIVRDEEALLPGCLASVAGLVDRIVVVDTGSTDRSVEIALAAGAEVVHHAWSDDFAAARNAGLARVRAGYVLVLDADERLGPGARRALRKVVRAGTLDCGLLPLHDAQSLDAPAQEVLDGRARRGAAVLLPRLLRRTPDLAFEGLVHESVGAWIRGKRVGRVAAPIVHYGAVPELRAARGKSERNLRLLRLRCEREPDHPATHAWLCRELERAGDLPGARTAADAAWAALERSARGGAPREDVVLPATLRAFLQLAAGELDAAAATLETARLWQAQHPNLDLLEGALHERLALSASSAEGFQLCLQRARACFARCLETPSDAWLAESLPGATSWAAATRAGTVELLAGEASAARAHFDRALAERPEHLEARLGRVEALIELRDCAQALREVEPALLREASPDAWTLAACAAAQLGSPNDARLFVDCAKQALPQRPWLAPHRSAHLQAAARGGFVPLADSTLELP